MPTETADYESLQTMVLDAVHAYEQARAVHLETEHQLALEQAAVMERLRMEEAQHRQEIDDEYRVILSSGIGTRAQIGQLAQLTSGLLEEAETLLNNAGLAYIAGSHEQDEPPDYEGDPTTHEGAARTFAAAVAAYAEVRTGLLRLGQQLVREKRWHEARQSIEPLLADPDTPLYDAGLRLLCASFYDEARWAMVEQAWPAARFALDHLLEIDPDYEDAAQLRKETYLSWRIVYWFHPERHKVLRSRWGTQHT